MARVEAYELQRQAHLEHIRSQIQDTELEECSFAPRVRKTRKVPQVWPESLRTFSLLSCSTPFLCDKVVGQNSSKVVLIKFNTPFRW